MKIIYYLSVFIALGFYACSGGATENSATTPEAMSQQGQNDQKVIQDFITAQGLNTNVTPSGIHYIINKEGDMSTTGELGSNANVIAHYHGTFLDGKVFDSSIERGKPFKFELGSVIPGWREAIRMLGVGGKGTFIIPSNLAYGQNGYPGLIGPNTVLKFDIEFLGVAGN